MFLGCSPDEVPSSVLVLYLLMTKLITCVVVILAIFPHGFFFLKFHEGKMKLITSHVNNSMRREISVPNL